MWRTAALHSIDTVTLNYTITITSAWNTFNTGNYWTANSTHEWTDKTWTLVWTLYAVNEAEQMHPVWYFCTDEYPILTIVSCADDNTPVNCAQKVCGWYAKWFVNWAKRKHENVLSYKRLTFFLFSRNLSDYWLIRMVPELNKCYRNTQLDQNARTSLCLLICKDRTNIDFSAWSWIWISPLIRLNLDICKFWFFTKVQFIAA